MSDGGPAFPSGKIDAGSCWEDFPYLGLSMRDYFAAKAMANFSIRAGSPSRPEELSDEEWAKWWEWSARQAYIQADAMLKAREQA